MMWFQDETFYIDWKLEEESKQLCLLAREGSKCENEMSGDFCVESGARNWLPSERFDPFASSTVFGFLLLHS